jgi:hypothetical protein
MIKLLSTLWPCVRGGAGRIPAPFAALRGSATREDVPFGDDIQQGDDVRGGEAGGGVVSKFACPEL